MSVAAIADRVLGGDRIDRHEALELYTDASTGLLGDLADTLRARRHPARLVTYIICLLYTSPSPRDRG